MASNDIKKFVKQDLRSSIEKIMYDYKRQFENGELFNIFVSAGIEQKENYMRNFLAELLRRDGSHGMGTLFLKSFVSDVLDIHDMTNEIDDAQIATEDVTDKNGTKRRMDITIETEKRFIPIEVKINARDQYKQCQAYYEEAKKRNSVNGRTTEETVIYYLTKDEHHRLSKESQGNVEGKQVKYIYFKNFKDNPENTKDIVSWLENCLRVKRVGECARVFLGLLQYKESIEFWFNRNSELQDIRDEVIHKFANSSQIAEFTGFIEKYSDTDPVILKIKECYDYYKNTILDNEFFGGIDEKIEKNSYIQQTETHKNAGSDYLCKPCKDCEGEEYEVWLTIEPANRERKLYIGYCLNKDGKYFRYEKNEEGIKELLGFDPNPESNPDLDQQKTHSYQYAPSGGWICRYEIEYDYKEIEKLVFNKNELDNKIGECVTVLNHLLNRRYGGTENAQPRNPI